MALRKDRRGMAVLVDALIFMVVLTLLIAIIRAVPPDDETDDRTEMLRRYHSVMLSGELPREVDSSMSTVTLSDFLIALSLCGGPDVEQVQIVERMVNGTIAELCMVQGSAWLIIGFGSTELHFGSGPSAEGDVYADSRELGDGLVVSTLYLA